MGYFSPSIYNNEVSKIHLLQEIFKKVEQISRYLKRNPENILLDSIWGCIWLLIFIRNLAIDK